MDRKALRAEVEAAALAELERVGPEAFRADAVVRVFLGRGADRATIYRWLQRLKESGRMGAHLAERVRAEAAEAAARSAEPSRQIAERCVALLPKPVRPDDFAATGGVLNFMRILGRCISTAEQVLRQSMQPDGTVRLTKTALSACEHLRRCMQTAAGVAESMRSIERVDAFHEAVVAEIEAVAPEAAARLRMRLQHLTSEWNSHDQAAKP